MKEKLIVIGVGPGAKQVWDFIRIHQLYDIIGFAVNEKYLDKKEYLGLPVFAIENLKQLIDIDEVKLFVSIGWNRLNADRREVYLNLKKDGFRFANLISPTAIIRGEIKGDNCWINDYTVLQSDSVINSNVTIREHVVIGNNTVIEDHCFIGVKSMIAGGCVIGEQSFCGINSTVFDGTNVGKKCIIGACTVVKRNVPDYSLYKTSSEMIIKQYDEKSIEEKLLFAKNVR